MRFFIVCERQVLHCLFGGFNCVWIWCVHCRYRPFIISLVFLFIAWARHGSAQNVKGANANAVGEERQGKLIHWKMGAAAVTESICTDYLLAYTQYEQYTRSQIPIEATIHTHTHTISKWHHIPALLCVFLFIFRPIYSRCSIALGCRRHHRRYCR